MRVMGIPHGLRLILPRVLALGIAMPLLVMWTNIIALTGGALAAKLVLGIDVNYFVRSLPGVVPIANLYIGVGKGVVFGMLIALVACHFGFRIKANSQSLGEGTTTSVVTSITVVILADAVFAILFQNVKPDERIERNDRACRGHRRRLGRHPAGRGGRRRRPRDRGAQPDQALRAQHHSPEARLRRAARRDRVDRRRLEPGKTTLVRQILGLERPTSGTIKVFGEDTATIDDASARMMRTRSGMLFQQGALFSSMTVFDNVAQPLRGSAACRRTCCTTS